MKQVEFIEMKEYIQSLEKQWILIQDFIFYICQNSDLKDKNKFNEEYYKCKYCVYINYFDHGVLVKNSFLDDPWTKFYYILLEIKDKYNYVAETFLLNKKLTKELENKEYSKKIKI